MKKISTLLVRILCITCAFLLAAVLLPAVKPLLQSLLPQAGYAHTSNQLTHAMQEAGELTAVTYTDTGVAVAETKALLVGTVQRVSIPYEYEIGFGFSLAEVVLSAGREGITVYLPEITMLHDRFTVTGDAIIEDFWYKLSEKRYQQIINEESLRCRNSYLESGEYRQAAWDAACKALSGLFSQWTGEENLPLTFLSKAEIPSSEPAF